MMRFFLLLLLLGSTANAAITRVQSKAGAANSASGLTLTMDSNLTVGNVLIIMVGVKPATGSPSNYINSSSLASFSAAASYDGTMFITTSIFYCIINAATTSVPIASTSGAGANPIAAIAVEY